ncbi:glycosyl hydrolase family 28-related protein [Ralstonia pickettii]|uniref:glycosyl hydrolase family 28-related protein n=1 Tax=Ralstonia pickettii TaxID=329 RepID=UPI0015FAF211|nr:glycosyl hydrolase family 28-related protein [Ralstonia pickettii]MBB0023623.1 hypothetical protein [Ralstonia pickettii]MBB0097018.1 hypothetical protein [Ralstonia pickettii]MBB0107012.1 hypothetical protein [Ralstonia pickettii]MBB0127791.1 hypothetical protein [Ralstonia pickettii]MBB0160712.1 hypothetical protein [Ralstonia pickettii]
MTISTTSNSVVAQGNGATTNFSFSFAVPSAAFLQVLYADTTGAVKLLPSSSYSVSGIGSSVGGSVTYPLSGPPIPAGTSLLIQRIVPYLQLTDLINQAGYYPNVVELALDYLTMEIQQLAQNSALSLNVPFAAVAPGLTFPNAAGRASKLAGFDASGNVAVYPITASVGAGSLTSEGPFVAGTNFTPGVTTSLTLSQAYGSAANVAVHFDGIYQGTDQYTLNGTQITFTSPIPVGVSKIYIVGGTTLSIYVPAANSVGDGQLSWGNILNRTVDSIAALASLNPSIYTRAFATGYYSAQDGGGGHYVYSSTTPQANANGGTIVASTYAGATGCWLLVAVGMVSIRQFGAKGDGTTDDTAATQSACTWASTNNRAIYVPSGTYKITSPIVTAYAFTMIGEAESPSVTPDYPQGVPVVVFLSTVAGDYCFKFGNTYQRGGQLRNFRVFGNGVNGSGIYLHNQGWDGTIDCVKVEGFQQYGVTMDYCQDMHVRSLGIIECGTENAYPSLNLVNGCNSVHFDRLHIEITPYMMNINNGGDITFNGCHFEVSEYPSGGITVVNRYSRYSQIIINNGSNHIDFNACLFAPGSVQATAAHFSVPETSIGPFMTVTGVKVNLRACQFRQTQTGKSSNMVSFTNSSSCLVDGCSFDQVYVDQYSIVLSGVTFVNNDVTWQDNGTSANFYGIANSSTGSPSIVDNNRFYCLNGSVGTKSAGYIFATLTAGVPLTLGYNEFSISVFNRHHNSACQAGSWMQKGLVNLTGFSGTLDCELFDTNTQFTFTVTSTVNSIINSCLGQRVKIWNSGGGTVTVTNGGTTVLKGATNALLPSNGILALENNSSGGLLIETSRNF